MIRTATISEDGVYRYTLERVWDDAKPRVAWVGLNPSKADHRIDDPSCRRMMDFGDRWGFGSICIMNLFAFRATDPVDLEASICDVVGPENDKHLSTLGQRCSIVMVAWGTHELAATRIPAVWAILKQIKSPKCCLGVTKNGSPRHPLYVRGDTKVLQWGIRE